MEAARPATPEDLADLDRLAAEAVAELLPQRGGPMWARTIGRRPPFAEGLARALEDPDVLVLCGTVHGSVVGYAVARVDDIADGGRLVVIEDLFTEPGARSVGVGESMLDAVVAWGTERRAVGVDAVVLPGDRDTKNFFESFGLKARALVVHRELP
jgi:GNAT superfamily N-acetyltransferase